MHELEEELSRTELLAYAAIIVLSILTVAYMLFIAAGLECPECNTESKLVIMKAQVDGIISTLLR